jgi:hypothetical protein
VLLFPASLLQITVIITRRSQGGNAKNKKKEKTVTRNHVHLALQVQEEGESVTRHAKGYRVSNHLEGSGNRVLQEAKETRQEERNKNHMRSSDHYRTFSLVASFACAVIPRLLSCSSSSFSLFHVRLEALFEVLQLGSSYSPYFRRRVLQRKETLLICLSEASFSF